MQIVINISKKLYDRYKEKDHIKRCDIDEFEKALDSCIILPKGHGRIGDLDALREEVYSWGMNDYEPSDFTDAIDDAPTIIEADKE